MKVIVNPGRNVRLAVTLGMRKGPGGFDTTKPNRGPGSILDLPGKAARFHIARGDVRVYEEPSEAVSDTGAPSQ
jgi:hypothetical protein